MRHHHTTSSMRVIIPMTLVTYGEMSWFGYINHDFSSIIFSDEGNILLGKEDPDLSYNQLIRPWKSRLAIIYVDNQSTALDLKIIFYTLVAIVSKQKSINWVVRKLKHLKVDQEIIKIAKRDEDLVPYPPPGTDKIVSSI